MREISRLYVVFAAAILIALPVTKGTEIATASNGSAREESALCAGRARASAVALLSSGGPRVALGLPWEEISTLD